MLRMLGLLALLVVLATGATAGIVNVPSDQPTIQAAVDVAIYWDTVMLADGIYSVRERSPYKEDFPAEDLDSVKDFVSMAKQWGKILATAHARGNPSLPKMVDQLTTGRHRELHRLVRELSFHYALLVEDDWKSFIKLKTTS